MSHADDVREELARLLRSRRVPGCSIAVRRGAEATHLHFGVADPADGRPVADDTVFHLFSGTKLYTAAALMLLCERGVLDLDAPVQESLPDLPLRHSVTPRQLASHSSGLRDTLGGFLAVHFDGEDAPTTGVALSRYKTHRGRSPGRKAAYRNVSFAILGQLITVASGVPYSGFVEGEILAPLKSTAAFEYSQETRELSAVGTIGRFSPMRWLFRLFYPKVAKRIERSRHGALISLEEFALDTAAIGGLIGSATDFLPLAAEFLSEESGVLSPESRREMTTLQARGRAGIASSVGTGLGWKSGLVDGVLFWNHEGGGNGFTSETRIYPESSLAVVILMNATATPRLSWLAHEMCERIRATSGESDPLPGTTVEVGA